MASTPFPTPPQAGLSISGSELPPQHHEVEFLLTHKAESPIIFSQKRDFLVMGFSLMGLVAQEELPYNLKTIIVSITSPTIMISKNRDLT